MSVIVDVEAKEGTKEAARRGKYALVKGSPEAVGALFAEGSAVLWYETAYLELAEQGCRVCALALRQLDTDADALKLSQEKVERNLRFVGFFPFECQVRADSALVIVALKTAGRTVAMVTGDAPLAALHVATNSCFADPARPSVLLSCRGSESPRVGPWPQVIAAGNRHRQARLRIWPSPSTLRSQRTSWRLSFSCSTIFPPFSLQSKNVRRKVVEVIDCLDHVPNVRSMPARGQGQKQRNISAMEERAHRRRAKAPISHRSCDKGWAFSASAEGNARGSSGSKPHGEVGASEGKCRPEAVLLAEVRASPFSTVMKGERSRSESRRRHRSEDRRCEWSGSGSDARSARIGARARGGNFHESGLLGSRRPGACKLRRSGS